MRDYDTIVVGGGPAGSTCAWRLVQAGRRVAIVDQSAFPRDKVCAGWITPAVVAALDFDPADYQRGARVWQPITGFTTGVMGRATHAIHYPVPVSYGIRRCEFDDYLLRRTQADLHLGMPVTRLEHTAGQWIVNDSLRAPMLVGAGGHACPVARQLGAHPGRETKLITAQEFEVALTPAQSVTCKVDGSLPLVYFCADFQGYGWCFRKGDYLNVGLGREDKTHLARHVQDWRRFLEDTGMIPTGLPIRFRGHAYLLYGHSQRPRVGDGVLLVGDAAGLAYTQSGEGIRPAAESGLLASHTIIHAGDDFSAARLADYETALLLRFGPRAQQTNQVPWLPQNLRLSLARYLLQRPWFVRHWVLDRWFLHRRQAPLNLAKTA